MKDAFGGILNIVLIAIFLIIVESILGLVVSYTKAFRMKNAIISTIEQYEASGCLGGSTTNTACLNKIHDRANGLGYSPTSLQCPNGYESIEGIFCIDDIPVDEAAKKNFSSINPKVYRVITQVDVNFPLIDKIFGFNIFQVSGDTKIIESPS